MPEHILVVGAGRDLPTRVRRAVPGAETSVICRLESVASLRELTEHTRVLAIRSDAPVEEWIELATAAHTRHPFTRIASFIERDQPICAAIGQALGLDTHTPDTVTAVSDKQAMRTRLRASGVDATASALVADVGELAAFTARFGFPCVVKPVSGAGSRGVSKVDGESGLAAAFERAGGSVLVEQFHQGPQFSVEAFSELGEHQVVCITRKFSDPVTFVELGHVSPADLTEGRREEIHTYVVGLLDALGVKNGPTHTEVVLHETGPRVIETHLRLGGDRIPFLTDDVTGVDLTECVVRQTVGDKVLPGIRATLAEPRAPRSSAIWFVVLPTAGMLTDVRGLDEARAIPGVTQVDLLLQPGTAVRALESSESRAAFVRALGATGEEALATARKAASLLEFGLRVHVGDEMTV